MALNCTTEDYTGKDVALYYHIDCGNSKPAEGEWKRLGSMRTKTFEVNWETVDATTDTSPGNRRVNLTTFQTIEFSGDGKCRASGVDSTNLNEVNMHALVPDGGKPVIWLKLMFPDISFIDFFNITNFSRSAPHDDIATFSISCNPAPSGFAPEIIEH